MADLRTAGEPFSFGSNLTRKDVIMDNPTIPSQPAPTAAPAVTPLVEPHTKASLSTAEAATMAAGSKPIWQRGR
jgi:hypothetical protein